MATIDAEAIALDATTGERLAGFGDGGEIDLRQGLRLVPRDFSDYEETSPPTVIGDLVVAGSAVADNGAVTQASGEVRAYDTVTGKLRWSWDPIPQDPRDPAAATWQKSSARRTGAANAWSVMAADPERHGLRADGQSQPRLLWRGAARDNRYANSSSL